MSNLEDEELRRELAYYKRHLDDLAARRISIEHHQWGLQMQLRQKKRGFQVVSRIAKSFGAETDPAVMFRVAVLAINSALEMDRTIILVPGARPGEFLARHAAGLSDEDLARISEEPFELPEALTSGVEALVVNRSAKETPLIRRIRSKFGLETFVCVSIAADQTPLGILLSGRLGGHASLFAAFDPADLDTFRAISAILQAVIQNTKLTRLEQTERLKAELYADLAHEFRTPLTLTLGPLEQILSGKWGEVPEAIRERLLLVERNQGRLLGLINEILELARHEAGAAELRPEPITDINHLINECALHFRTAAEARGLRLELTFDPGLQGRAIFADRAKLERALFNLLSNALKFTELGRIEVRTAVDEDQLMIEVADTGPGIAEEDLPHVFERFRRATNAGQTPGSGIGLALVKQLVELHQGSVSVESQKGKGSRFRLRIPLNGAQQTPQLSARSSADGASRPQLPPQQSEAQVGASNRVTEERFDGTKPIVLYVEDDADLRAHVRDSLADAYNLFLAADGDQGLSLAQRYRPDLIITDQSMPRTDGRTFLRALQADSELRSIPVVFLTAQHGIESRIESLEAGADDYVQKPFHEAELRARVANLIQGRANERQLIELNRRLNVRVREQTARLDRAEELERFLPRMIVDRLRRAQGDAASLVERRSVSVLVTQVSALAVFSERLPELAMAELASRTFGAIARICAAHGGLVDSFAGGRFSVIFGVLERSTPSEAALSAASSALEIREATLDLHAEVRRRGLPDERCTSIGIASGACLVGAFGDEAQGAYTAIGPPTITAAVLQAEGAPGAIVCDEETRGLLGSRARLRPLTGDRHELLDLQTGPDAVLGPPRSMLEVGAPAERSLRREGDYWTIDLRGRVFRLKGSKGLEYLSYLLARPHLEVHVFDLVAAVDEGERAPSVRVERDSKVSAETERVRLNVTRAMRSVVGKIADLDPELGRHLNDCLRTGAFCAYAPPQGVPHSWLVST